MFQYDWGDSAKADLEPALIKDRFSSLPAADVAGLMLLHWQEHCLECAPPLCYTTCPLYVPRADEKCARFSYGIVKNPATGGPLGYVADLRFRRWGKLETELRGKRISPASYRLLARIDTALTACVNALAAIFKPVSRKRRLNGAYSVARAAFLRKIGKAERHYDSFVLECFTPETDDFRLNIELRREGVTILRHGVLITPGHNFHTLDIPLPDDIATPGRYLLMVYPEADREVRLVFSWLDFVVMAPDRRLPAPPAPVSGPAPKIKCVAWDLDNTLWKGILVEDGPEKLALRKEAANLIHKLDDRGIIQTIVSKNNHDDAMAVLRQHGLEEYFIYPAINWGQKSANLQQVAKQLNIGLDTFALIDDSPFERNEVASALPMVRVYPENELEQLPDQDEFDVPVTETARLRRQSYLADMQRHKVEEIFSGDYLGFLKSCELKLRLFRPERPEESARCLELIQRSNQLNLSSRRYSPEEFDRLLAGKDVLCVAMDCEDRFGRYGIVGFVSVNESGSSPVISDFVLSCRVAQKRVEHAFFRWLAREYRQHGQSRLLAGLIRTPKNKPLVKVFEDMRFETESSEGDRTLLFLDLDGTNLDDDGAISLESAPLDELRKRP